MRHQTRPYGYHRHTSLRGRKFVIIKLIANGWCYDDESAALRMQTDAYDDKGRGDEVEMELQLMEGPAIDHKRQSSLSRVVMNVNANNSKTKAPPCAHEDVSGPQESVE